ncbi:golgin subfamily A member 4 isoform X2 [Manihot esculenta]|uniref:Uncharacterized protein n=1 Tax=Manihot esculenta TaxID=3983 RepID=A0ACB7IGC3_MANES|nr:golgin subfamily A member 4 isoform X2 [Manihot esculenta]KAG8663264.1 hypothetical protein MANES_01G193300v8 [Manihot esculenta]
MELLKLSKFKVQLQAITSELRDLRVRIFLANHILCLPSVTLVCGLLQERERSATKQCHILIQKQKQSEEEYGRKLQDLQAELASSNELRHKLDRQMSYLQDDNALLENRLKEMQGTIQSLLQSRESFVHAYEESTCEMKRSIEARDRKLGVLSEKLNSHLSLFDSIEKEAFSIKQVLDNVQLLVLEKEEVAGLRSKMDKVSAFEEVFVEKVHDLKNKLKNNEDELQTKGKIISELEGQLEAANIRNNCQNQIEELQKNLVAKDAVIQSLISEKEALQCEVGNLAVILQKVKETVKNMDDEDKKALSSALKCQDDCDTVRRNEDNRIEADVLMSRESSTIKAPMMGTAENLALPTCQVQHSVGNILQENNHLNSCVSEAASSELQSAINGPSIAEKNEKVIAAVHHLDSECSTTQADTSDQKCHKEKEYDENNAI